jgi:hypothetical protein
MLIVMSCTVLKRTIVKGNLRLSKGKWEEQSRNEKGHD